MTATCTDSIISEFMHVAVKHRRNINDHRTLIPFSSTERLKISSVQTHKREKLLVIAYWHFKRIVFEVDDRSSMNADIRI